MAVTTYTPEAVAAGRALLAGEKTPPAGCLSKVFTSDWERLSYYSAAGVPHLETDLCELSDDTRELIEGGDTTARLRTIDLALQELFALLHDDSKCWPPLWNVANYRLHARLHQAALEEMRALLLEWDRLTVGDRESEPVEAARAYVIGTSPPRDNGWSVIDAGWSEARARIAEMVDASPDVTEAELALLFPELPGAERNNAQSPVERALDQVVCDACEGTVHDLRNPLYRYEICQARRRTLERLLLMATGVRS